MMETKRQHPLTYNSKKNAKYGHNKISNTVKKGWNKFKIQLKSRILSLMEVFKA